MGSKSSAPPAPDYTAAAERTGQSSKEVTNMQTWANRPEQYTPWGSINWQTEKTVDPATGQEVTQWTQQQQLNPELQAALDQQLGLQRQRSDLAGGFMGRVADEYGQQFDWSNLPGMAQNPNAQFTQGRDMQSFLPAYQLSTNYNGPMTTGQERIDPTGQLLQGAQQTTQTANEPGFVQERQRIEQALFDRMRPEQQFQEDRTRTMLANQGLTPGSEAYNRELARLQDTQAAERYNAMNQAGGEQARLQQMLMGQQQQAYGQDQASRQFTNQALQNLFQQQQQAGQFGLGAQQQGYAQQLGSQEAYNRALAQQQQLQQNAGSFYNQAQQQMFGQDLAGNQQNFQQMMAAANFQNQLRQQAIAEQMQQRGMSLNEMNALLYGQQVQSPTMPGFTTAQASQPVNYMGAAQAQYGANQDAFNAGQAGQSSMMSGLFGLGGAMIGGPFGAALGSQLGGAISK